MAIARPIAGRQLTLSLPVAAVLVGALVLLGIAVRTVANERIEWLSAALVVFGSLLVQAMPFVLVGALASAAIEVLVPVSAFERIGRLPGPFRLPAAALAGTALPICECGSVPVARRLIEKGLPPAAAITFMLAAPVVNPVVIASTVFAYRGRAVLWPMVLGRVGLGLVVAIAVGWALGSLGRSELIRAAARSRPVAIEVGSPESRWRRFWMHLAGDFLFLGRYLVLGASVAAAIQTFLPQRALQGIATTPIVDVLILMVLAAVLSLCSEWDAFIAASFTGFRSSAQLAFLVFGPMVDLKLGALYVATFRRGAALTIVAVAGGVTLVGAAWLGVFTG